MVNIITNLIFTINFQVEMLFGMHETLDWQEIVQAKRTVKTSDHTNCGNVVAEYQDNIIIIEFEAKKMNGYMIPKSRVDHYDGRNVHLSIPGSLLPSFDF
jgi:hypothetical protein